jgi:hypothetical protein
MLLSSHWLPSKNKTYSPGFLQHYVVFYFLCEEIKQLETGLLGSQTSGEA